MKLFFSTILIVANLFGCTTNKSNLTGPDRNIISSSLSIIGSTLVYSTWTNEVVVENLKTKKIIKTKTFSKCYAKPLLLGDKLYFPLSDSIFTCVEFPSLKTLWRAKLGGKCREFYVTENSIIANAKHYGLVSFDKISGRNRFELLYKYNNDCLLPDLSPYNIDFDDDTFYVCDWLCSNISAFRMSDGALKWKKKLKDGTSRVVAKNDLLFYGINEFNERGEISLMDRNGNELYSEVCFFDQNFKPITYNNKIYYYSYDAKLNEFDFNTRISKVVYNFKPEEDVVGNQMHLLNGILYYNSGENIYGFNLKDFKLELVGKSDKNFYGLLEVDNKIVYIF